MDRENIELMMLDVRLPGISGFDVLKITKENYPYVEVIVISVMKELDTAIEAMRYGAYHYISKDFDIEGVRTLVANASERQDLNRLIPECRAPEDGLAAEAYATDLVDDEGVLNAGIDRFHERPRVAAPGHLIGTDRR